MTRPLHSLLCALLILGGSALATSHWSGMTGSAAQAQAQDGGSAEAGATAPEVETMSLGEADAPVEVIEYASFTCPHCRDFHEGPFEEIKANYIDTGKVRFTYREVYFDRFGLWAGMLARCGGEERYFGLVNLLYEEQRDWTQGDPSKIATNLRRLGKTAGLSDERIEACLTDAAKAEAMVAKSQEDIDRDEVSATPTFVIDGQTYSNMPYDQFAAILDEKLAEEEG